VERELLLLTCIETEERWWEEQFEYKEFDIDWSSGEIL
jgi:hypothetical protein